MKTFFWILFSFESVAVLFKIKGGSVFLHDAKFGLKKTYTV